MLSWIDYRTITDGVTYTIDLGWAKQMGAFAHRAMIEDANKIRTFMHSRLLHIFFVWLQIILGSSSVHRQKVLAEMGYDFTIMVYYCRLSVTYLIDGQKLTLLFV